MGSYVGKKGVSFKLKSISGLGSNATKLKPNAFIDKNPLCVLRKVLDLTFLLEYNSLEELLSKKLSKPEFLSKSNLIKRSSTNWAGRSLGFLCRSYSNFNKPCCLRSSILAKLLLVTPSAPLFNPSNKRLEEKALWKLIGPTLIPVLTNGSNCWKPLTNSFSISIFSMTVSSIFGPSHDFSTSCF